MTRSTLPVVIGLAMILIPMVSLGFTVSIERVADTTTERPGAADLFTALSWAAVDESGVVVFFGEGTSGSGIYKDDGVTLSRVADNSAAAPDGLGTFTTFSAPDISDSNIMFRADFFDGINGGDGVFKEIGAGLVTVDTGDGNDFRDGSIFGEIVAYKTEGQFSESIWSDFDGIPAREVGTGTAVPGSESDTFRFVDGAVIDDTQIVFEARYFSGLSTLEGIFTKNLTTGVVDVVADDLTPRPGGLGTFSSSAGCSSSSSGGFSASTSDGNVVLYGRRTFFSGGIPDQEGIYSDRDGALAVVADRNTPVPEGTGNFDFFNCRPMISHSNVVFLAWDEAGKSGYYADFDGELGKVIDVSDTLDGKALTSVGSPILHSPHGFNGNKFAFLARFADGSSGIYVATLPEPSGTVLLASGVGFVAALARRQRRGRVSRSQRAKSR